MANGRLEIMNGGFEGMAYDLNEEEVILGRNPTTNITLPHLNRMRRTTGADSGAGDAVCSASMHHRAYGHPPPSRLRHGPRHGPPPHCARRDTAIVGEAGADAVHVREHAGRRRQPQRQ